MTSYAQLLFSSVLLCTLYMHDPYTGNNVTDYFTVIFSVVTG